MRDMIFVICQWTGFIWTWAGFALFINRRIVKIDDNFIAICLKIFRILKPLYIPIGVIETYMIIQRDDALWSKIFTIFFIFFCWYVYKDEDKDDWWKKAKEKVSGMVKSMGHKLVVAPSPT